jgi:hypothetical protein
VVRQLWDNGLFRFLTITCHDETERGETGHC